jgi:ABC-type phosphate transport system permease subunit
LYYYWRHTSLWWSGVVLAAAGVLILILILILVAGLLVQILRHVHGRWRVVTMALGADAWLCGAACLAVLGSQMRLTCGSTSQLMSADIRRP